MHRMLKPLLFATALSSAFVLTGEASVYYHTVTTQTVDSVESEINWLYEETSCETRGRITTALKLVSVDGTLIEASPNLPTVVQAGGKVLSVVEYGDEVFADQPLIETIVIPATVRKIGKWAFANCWSLRSVTLGNAVTEIGDETFCDCETLSSATLNEGLRYIGKRPFVNTIVSSLKLPSTLLNMDGNISAGALFLSEINVEGTQFAYSDDGSLYNKAMTRLYGCPTAAETVTLPSTLEEIKADAFFGCSRLSSIEIPTSVVKIGSEAFNVGGIWSEFDAPESAAYLKSVVYLGTDPDKIDAAADIYFGAPADMATRARGALWKAKGTTWLGRALIVDNGQPESDGGEVIDGIKWDYSILSDGTATIRSVKAIDDSTILSLTLPTMLSNRIVKAIGTAALANLRGIMSVDVPSTYETIGDGAFSNCTSLASVTIPSGVRSLGKAPFSGTAITSLSLPNTLTRLDGNPLAGCAFLTSVSVDAGNQALAASDGLLFDAGATRLLACVPSAASAVLPATLEAIADDAFAGCARLLAVSALCEVPAADDAVFADTPAGLVVSADAWTLQTWQNYIDKKWHGRAFINSGIPDDSGIQTYTDNQDNIWHFKIVSGEATIVGLDSMPSGEVAIPSAVTDSSSGTSVAVTSVGANVFVNGSEITKITIPASVTDLAGSAFVGCTALESFAVDAGNAKFGSRYGALYSRDGKRLVKVPACFCFATTVSTEQITSSQSVIEVVNGYDKNLTLSPNTIIALDSASTVTSTTVRVFSPAVSDKDLMRGVTYVADYAFSDCGHLPAGTIADGTLVTLTDGKRVSTETGTIVIAVGTDATNETSQTSTVTKSGFYNEKPAMWKTVQSVSAKHSTDVPKPDIGTAGCSKLAWYGSVWYDEIPDDLIPALAADASAEEVADALDLFADANLSANVKTASEYESFRTWAMAARSADKASSAGQQAILSSAVVWYSYALDSDVVLAKAPQSSDLHVETTTAGNGSLRLAISVDGVSIGSNASSQNLKKVLNIQGSTSLNPAGFSSDNVELYFDAPKAGKVSITVRPAQSNPSSFFTKIGIN